jgi:sigma-B regulation protein RsbU (phosphoserine phosphatase)
MRILIADDDPVTSLRLKALAENWGYEPLMTRDGPSTLRMLETEGAPRLVLLDWIMPGIAGLQICNTLRRRTGGDAFYIVMLTARQAHADMVAGFDAGVDDFLVKPFDADELRGRLKAGARIVELQQRLATHVEQLTAAAANIKTLTGMLPICGYCKAIRDDSHYWHQLEEFVSTHSNAEFSHGICPACLEKAVLEAG